MTHTFSAAVKLADLDDFLSPAQSCILPLLDNRNRNKNVADRPDGRFAAAVLPSADAAADAYLHSSVSNHSRHGRTLKTERHAETQELVPPLQTSSARAASSSAADRDGLVISGGAVAVGGTASEQSLAFKHSSSSKSSSAAARSSTDSAAANKRHPFPSFDARPSLITLGQSRSFKKQGNRSQLHHSPAVAAGRSGSSSSSSSSASPSSSSASSTFSTSSTLPGTSPGGAADTALAAKGEKQVAQVALYDCLACKGCVTSAEAVLVERHSVDEFLRRTGVADRCRFAASRGETNFAEQGVTVAAESPSATADEASAPDGTTTEANRQEEKAAGAAPAAAGTAAGTLGKGAPTVAAAEEESSDPPPRLIVVSVSPQSLAALAQHFRMQSAAATLRKLSSLFRLAGATHVLHTAAGDALSVLEVEREFIERCREAGIGRRQAGGRRAAAERGEEKATATAGAREAAPAARASAEAATEDAAGSTAKTELDARAPAKGATIGVREAAVAAAVAAEGQTARRLPVEQRREREGAPAVSREYDNKRSITGGISAPSCLSDACSSDTKSSNRNEDPGGGRFPKSAAENVLSSFNGAQRQQEPQQQQQEQRRKEQEQRKHHDQHEQQLGENSALSRVSTGEETDSVCALPLFASFCPGFVCYAETSYDAPLLLQHMSRVRSGQQIQGVLVKGLLLELHNAAAFLLRSAALAAIRPGAGIPPLLFQLLLRRSVYASPTCRKTAPLPVGAVLGEGAEAEESSAAARRLRSGAASPGAGGWHGRDAPRAGAPEACTEEPQDTKEEDETAQLLERQVLQQRAELAQACCRRPARPDVGRSARFRRSGVLLSFDGGCLTAAEEVRREDVFHVCIMPCFDKKLEAARPEFRHPVAGAAAAAAAPSAVPAPARTTTGSSPTTAAAAASTAAADGTGAPVAWEEGKVEASPASVAAAECSGREESSGTALSGSSSSTPGSNSSAGTSSDVAAADVDLVLATNEVLMLLQRMHVQFEDLPETHVDTFLDDYIPLRTSVSAGVLPGGLAAAAARDAIAAADAGAPEIGAPLRRGQNAGTRSNLSSISSKDDTPATSSGGILKQIASSSVYLNVEERPRMLSCFASAVLCRLRSVVLSPCRRLYATVTSPYISSRWWWWGRGGGRAVDVPTAAAAARPAATREILPLTTSGATALPSKTEVHMKKTWQMETVGGFAGPVMVQDMGGSVQASCNSSTECSAPGTRRGSFSAAAADLCSDGRSVSSSSNGRGRTSGDRGDGTPNNDTNLSRQSSASPRGDSSGSRKRGTPPARASLGREKEFLRRAITTILQHSVHQEQTQRQQRQQWRGTSSHSNGCRSVGTGDRRWAHEKDARRPAAAGDTCCCRRASAAEERSCVRRGGAGSDASCAAAVDGEGCSSCGAAIAAAACNCFISSEQVCGSGGYAERLFRRAAEELFNVRVDGPVLFQKRKGGNEGFREAVLVVDGEEKLRVALAYGFKNIQVVIQKLKRHRQLALQLAPAPESAVAACTAPGAATVAGGRATAPASASASNAGGDFPAVVMDLREQRQQQERQDASCQGQREEKPLRQQQGRRALRPLPHFIEFAACPGGCLGGGGQKLEGEKKDISDSSSLAAEASRLHSAGPAANVEKRQKSDELLQERQQDSVRERENFSFSISSSNHKTSAQGNETATFTGKGVDCSASAGTAGISSAGRIEEGRGAGDGGKQSQSLAALTALLHHSHVYCEPLQRVEVQLAYLYLLTCAEHAEEEWQKQPGAEEEANSPRQQQQELLQQRQHKHVTQDEERVVQHTEAPLLPFQDKMQPQQQENDEDKQKQPLHQQEAQHQRQRQEQQQKRVQQEEGAGRAGREEYFCGASGKVLREEITAGREASRPFIVSVSVLEKRTAGRKAGDTREGTYNYSALRHGKETVDAAPSSSTRTGTSEYTAADAVAGRTAESAEGVFLDPPRKPAEATEAAAETTAAKAAEMPEAAAPLGWWETFGENKTAVKLLRTRFRHIWGGNMGTVQSQKSGAGLTEETSSTRPGHRGVGAKPSLHW